MGLSEMMLSMRMTCKMTLMALALTGMAAVAQAGMVDEENAGGANVAAKADATTKAATQASNCEKAVEEVNEALEKGQIERAKRLKQQKDAVCSQQFSAAKADEKKVVQDINDTAAPQEAYQMPSSVFSQDPIMDTGKLYASDNAMDKVKVVNTKVNENPSLGGTDNKLTMGYMKEVGGNTVGSAKFQGQGTNITAHEVNVNSNMLSSKSIGSYSIKEMNDAGTVKVGLASKVGSINPNDSSKPTAIPLGQQISFDSKAYLKDGTIKANNAISGYGMRKNPITGKMALHAGTDYTGVQADGTRNTDILASGSGKVVESKCVSGGYGCTVIIDHGNGVYTRYAHLSAQNVKVGDTVAQGDRIATMGSTGGSQGTHLHYEVLNGGTNPRANAVATIGTTSTYNEQIAGKFGTSVRPAGIGNSGSTGSVYAGGGNTSSGGGSTGSVGSVATGGLGSTLQTMLGSGSSLSGNTGMSQILSQLFNGGGSSSDSSSSGSSSGASSSTASDNLVVKTVTEVAANGDTTRTTTYASGRSEQVVIKNTGTSTDLEALLTSAMGKTSADSVLASIKALCASKMATSSDADMLKISQCQSGTGS